MTIPEVLYVGQGSKIAEYTAEPWEEIERDPRGVALLWEPPIPHARYIMGLDSAEGITGWTRATRIDGDHKKDNSVIEIFRVDGMKEPQWKMEGEHKIPDIDPVTKQQRVKYRDVQVAEFAAPCDAVEIARIANVLGRIYAGDSEDQCELIWEAWPGCGMLTTQELLRLGYGNLWHWEHISDIVEETQRLGWSSTRESQKILWYRARRHLMEQRAVIRSRFLREEYASAEIDMDKMRARASYGSHDDRFMAANLCFWAGHKWVYDPERTWEDVSEAAPVVDFQHMAPTLDDHMSFQDWKARMTEDWYE